MAEHVHALKCDDEWVSLSPVDGSVVLVQHPHLSKLFDSCAESQLRPIAEKLVAKGHVVQLVDFVQMNARTFRG